MAAYPRVVVVGGGFGGLYAARALARAPLRITLIDCRNHHLFQPLLYQVATAGLDPSDIAVPIRRILRRQLNTEVLLAEATRVDPTARRVLLTDGELPYDFLVLATGVTHSYFGHDGWARFAPGLKSIEDALDMRRRLFLAFEAAEREANPDRRRSWMTFVIIGAGSTGVELAGTLAEIARHSLASDFRHIDPRQARVILIEGLHRVLPAIEEQLSASARRQLLSLGVEIRTSCRVTDLDGGGVRMDREYLPARTVLWAAGVSASPLARSLGAPLDRVGRVRVCPDLTIPDHPEVFVIGDLAAIEQDGLPLPGIAPVAMQQGKHAAANIRRSLTGSPHTEFRYRDKGLMAAIGRGRAIARIGRLRFSGFPAWLIWLFVHILFLIGFRNRFLVLFEWAWSFFTYDRGARLITGGDRGAPPATGNSAAVDKAEGAS